MYLLRTKLTSFVRCTDHCRSSTLNSNERSGCTFSHASLTGSFIDRLRATRPVFD